MQGVANKKGSLKVKKLPFQAGPQKGVFHMYFHVFAINSSYPIFFSI
jgi:hypothetical protein